MNTIIHDLLASESALARELGSAEQRLAQQAATGTASAWEMKKALITGTELLEYQIFCGPRRIATLPAGDGINETNARLVAAAPALLAALKSMLAVREHQAGAYDNKTIVAARAALALALG